MAVLDKFGNSRGCHAYAVLVVLDFFWNTYFHHKLYALNGLSLCRKYNEISITLLSVYRIFNLFLYVVYILKRCFTFVLKNRICFVITEFYVIFVADKIKTHLLLLQVLTVNNRLVSCCFCAL